MKEGETARFELELSHENIPVTWYRNDVKIHPSRTVLTHVDGKKHVLEIKDVTLDDICQIKAEAKGIPSMANLTVIGKREHLFVLSVLPVSRCLCAVPQQDLFLFVRRVFSVVRNCVVYLCFLVFSRLFCLSMCCVHSVDSYPQISPFQRAMRTSQLSCRTILQWRKTSWF